MEFVSDELNVPSITEISKDLGMDKHVLKVMEAKFMDLENQVTKINGALNILYSKYSQGGKGWPYQDFDLPFLVPLGEDETVVKVEDVKSIIAGLAKSNEQIFKRRFIQTGLSTPSTPPPPPPPPPLPPPPPPPAPRVDPLQILGGKKKTYKKRHTKKKRRHTKRRSTKRKHYKKTRKH